MLLFYLTFSCKVLEYMATKGMKMLNALNSKELLIVKEILKDYHEVNGFNINCAEILYYVINIFDKKKDLETTLLEFSQYIEVNNIKGIDICLEILENIKPDFIKHIQSYDFNKNKFINKDIINYFTSNEEIDCDFDNIGVDEYISGTDSFSMYMKEAMNYSLLSAQEEFALAKKVQMGDLEARELFINSNLRLVIAVAKHYCHSGVSLEDLVQYGNIGLMIAVDKFNPDLGYKFSTHAIHWIRQAITREIANNSRIIRFPVHVHQDIVNINSFEKKYEVKYGFLPTPEEIAQGTGYSIWKVRDRLQIRLQFDMCASLSAKINDNEDTELLDFLPTTDDEPVDEILKNDLHDIIVEILSDKEFPVKEAVIIILRQGLIISRDSDLYINGFNAKAKKLMDGMPHTLNEIADVYNVTRERIRQIENKGLYKLRRYKNRLKIMDYNPNDHNRI